MTKIERQLRTSPPTDSALQALLGFFYPIHYQIGMELERRLGQQQLSRQQVAIIWLIQSEVGLDGWIRRKTIELTLCDSFESRNSHVSILLRELSSPPLSLVVQKTNPECAREKLVSLTDKGREFFNSMVTAGVDYFREILPHLSEEELISGMKFLNRAFGLPVLNKRID